MKKIFMIVAYLLLAENLSAAAWTGATTEPENMKKIDGKSFYVITNADELAWFAVQINNGKNINGVLEANITLGTTYAWTPIGKDSTKMFQSFFDGGNYTITTPYTKTGNFAGLFGVIGANGTVKNVKIGSPNITHTRYGGSIAGFNNGTIDNVIVTGGKVTTSSNSAFSGGIVGQNAGVISNAKNSANISWTGNIGGNGYAGGISGINQKNGRLSSVTNNGTVIGKNALFVGGITGKNTGLIHIGNNNAEIKDSLDLTSHQSVRSYIGGLIGYNNGSIDLSTNSGNVLKKEKQAWDGGTNTTDTIYVGGGVGYNVGTIKTSVNKQKVSFNGIRSNSSKIYATILCMGGLSGYNGGQIISSIAEGSVYYSSERDMSIEKCYFGGVVGINQGSSASISNSYSVVTSITSTITNVGEFKKGGIAGQNLSSAKIVNTYYDQTLLSSISAPVGTQSATLTNSSGKSSADMKKDQFAWILNSTNGTATNSGNWSRNDSYPIFSNDSYKAIYKVVFNDEGATSNRYTNYKGLVTFPDNPEPAEGFIFSGWYNASDIKVKSTTVFSADQTVRAIYVDASDVFWTINFYNAAPADTLLESKSYQHGSIVAYGGNVPTKAATAQYSYTFKGWDVEPTNAVEDFNYHAVYDSTIRSYTIVFNNFDGSKIESATFEYGKMPSCNKTPTRAATAEWKWTHKGWMPDLDYVTGGSSYTAIYDSVKVEYKVTFMNGVDVIDEQMVPYGDAAVAPTNVTREGYKFVGWNTSFSKVTENLTVKALFEELIIRTINLVDNDGESITNQNVEDGETYILPEAPVKEGYTFDAYYDGNTKLGVAGESISITGNITIVARYIVNEYVISFVDADNTVLQSSNVAYGIVPSAPTNPTKTATIEYAYTFLTWSPEIVAVAGPATYTAVYDSSKVMYKVVFMNGTEIIKEQMVPYGGAAEAPTNVSREGYKFIGWNTTFEKITSALTVNALFEEQPSSSSVAASSSSSIPKSSSSSIVASSSSVKSSSSEAKSSSSKVGSSSSAKTDAITANLVSRFTVQVYAHALLVSEANVGDNCALFDMQGRLLYQGRVVASDFKIEIPVSGTYLMRIGNSIKKVTVK